MSNPLNTKRYTAGAAINKHRIVKFDSSDGVVIQGAAATDLLVGVNESLDAASGEGVDIIHTGIAEIRLGGSVTRGGLVTSDATGQAVAAAPAAGVNNAVIGRALVSGASGDIIPVLLGAGQIQGA